MASAASNRSAQRGSFFVAAAVHLSFALIAGAALTYFLAWYSFGAFAQPGGGRYQLGVFTIATPLVIEKIRSGNAGWANGSVVYLDQLGQRSLIWGGTARGEYGGYSGNVYRYSVDPATAELLLSRGAVAGLDREWPNGPVPTAALRRVSSLGTNADCAAVIYAGWLLPTVACEITFDNTGRLIATSGAVTLEDKRLLPCRPFMPGFALSTAVLGVLAWAFAAVVFQTLRFAATAARKKLRPPPPATVACPGCGYPRRGLASIDVCPECGNAGPAGAQNAHLPTREPSPPRV